MYVLMLEVDHMLDSAMLPFLEDTASHVTLIARRSRVSHVTRDRSSPNERLHFQHQTKQQHQHIQFPNHADMQVSVSSSPQAILK